MLGFNSFITLLVYSFLSDREECCFLLHVHLKPNSYLALHVHKYQEVQLDKLNFNFSSDFGFQRLSKRNNYDQPNPFPRFLFCAPVHFHPPHNLQTHCSSPAKVRKRGHLFLSERIKTHNVSNDQPLEGY